MRATQARFVEAESKLRAERATLARYDEEIKSLDANIKQKKQAITDSEIEVKKLEHDLQTLQKDRTAAANLISNLEKQYEWIAEEHE